MLRDSLAELHHASGVGIVQKVRNDASLAYRNHNSQPLQLLDVLDIGMLREIGNSINEIVRLKPPCFFCELPSCGT